MCRNLMKNDISELDAGAFESLRNLNKLSVIHLIAQSRRLPFTLHYRHLDYNPLVDLPMNVFSPLRQVNVLEIRYIK